ncbi:hypothetical protein E3N88_24033 [Mikania micrantha]|uniref:Uncharacterized protein n=1 Tax=Mikania micrantha TaxID=192012 RepID=A0A5N6NF03_9ASTR|nr:hypothetical protein E3N88_24033 [Mikania micrantha]
MDAADLSIIAVVVTVAGAIVAFADPHWLQAMQAKFSALQENKTWELVPRPSDRPVIFAACGFSDTSSDQMALSNSTKLDSLLTANPKWRPGHGKPALQLTSLTASAAPYATAHCSSSSRTNNWPTYCSMLMT